MGLRPPDTCDIMHPSVALRYTKTLRTANLYLNLPMLRMLFRLELRVEFLLRFVIKAHGLHGPGMMLSDSGAGAWQWRGSASGV